MFPELAITGYPPEDLLLKPGFIADNRAALEKVAAETRSCVAVVGFVDAGRDLWNAAAVCAHGEVVGVYHKRELPNYAVFDEARYFARGAEAAQLWSVGGISVGVSICEDAWNPAGPILDQADSGAELIVNLNASPYAEGKLARRERMMATRAADASCALVYVNQVGGQDELVFDGGSMVFDAEGELIARSPQFVEDVLIVDLEVEPVYRKRLLDPRGRPSDVLLPIEVDPRRGGRGHRGHAATAPRRRCRRRPIAAGARPRRGGVPGHRARHPRLPREERLHRRGHRPLGRHRLHPRGRHRRRRHRRRPRARRVDAVALLQRPLQERRRPAGREPGHRLPHHRHRAGPRRRCSRCWPPSFEGRDARPHRGEPPEPASGA